MIKPSQIALRWTLCTAWALLLGGLVISPVGAVIEALTSLENFTRDADLILIAHVKQIDLEQGRLVLAVESSLKGADQPGSLPVRLAGNASEALAKVNQGDQAVLFISRGEQQNLAYAYSGGAWFLIVGTHDQENVRWKFKAGEPYLRRSYADDTYKLIELLKANQAGTGGLPPPDAMISPGYSLVSGKHPAPLVSQASPIASTPDNVVSPPLFNRNAWLVAIGAGCACALAWMLVRSVPVEDADV